MKTLQLFKNLTFSLVFAITAATCIFYNSEVLGNNSTGNKFDADNQQIQYVGRIDFSNPKAPKFSASGVYITAKFVGTYCDIELKDENKWGKNRNFFQIVIDNNTPVRYQTELGKTIYRVAENLAQGEHSILIVKDSEGSIGYLQFMGIWCETLITPPALPERKIECFGNSITCGSGTVSSLCEVSSGSNWYLSTSAYASYGAIMAHELNAQYHLTSQSGIGLIHSCCNMPNTMMDSYNLMHIDNPAGGKWDFSKYIPDVVTLALGQNDGIQDSALFVGKYIEFVKTLRKYYPQTSFFLITSPMSDDQLLAFQKKTISEVVDYFNRSGDTKVYKVFLTNKLNAGCTTHPDAEQHKRIAAELSSEIKNIMHW